MVWVASKSDDPPNLGGLFRWCFAGNGGVDSKRHLWGSRSAIERCIERWAGIKMKEVLSERKKSRENESSEGWRVLNDVTLLWKMGGFLGGGAPKDGVDRMKRSCVGAFFLENAYSSQKIPKKFQKQPTAVSWIKSGCGAFDAPRHWKVFELCPNIRKWPYSELEGQQVKRLIFWNLSNEQLSADGNLIFCMCILLVLVHMLFYYHFVK